MALPSRARRLPRTPDVQRLLSSCPRSCTTMEAFNPANVIQLLSQEFASFHATPHSEADIEAKNRIVDLMSCLMGNKPVNDETIRPPDTAPLVGLKVNISDTLTKTLESLASLKPAPVSEENGVIAIGSACHNTSCRQTYDGTNMNSECVFHDGTAVFHEGMKYWSCCQRKTSDFSAFLDQSGCTTGKHVWRKVKVAATDVDKSSTCRLDWYQTGDLVVVTIYAKHPIPSQSLIQANPVKLVIRIAFGEDRQEFEKDITLFGVIDVLKSSVSFKDTRVEITMKKAELVSWPRISL